MNSTVQESTMAKPVHSWLQQIHLANVPGPMTPMVEAFVSDLLDRFQAHGHIVQETPDDDTKVMFTTVPFGESLDWRKALLFSARRTYKLKQNPTLYSIVYATPEQAQELLDHFEAALQKEPPDPEDFKFPGLAPEAYQIFIEQARRGGPILALERLVQAQSKSIKILLLIGQDEPEMVYHFDLVGAHPRSIYGDPQAFYDDIVLRTITTVSTREVTNHEVLDDTITRELWDQTDTAERMRQAAFEFDKRRFFTDMARISDFVLVPAVGETIADQYSEGCYATWDPKLDGLLATITGSARPVDKGNITEDDLALIVGVQPDGSGAIVRHVEGKRNDPPSSEAVELFDLDSQLPRIQLGEDWDTQVEVPVVRSKLHGHRGIRAYNPETVEYAPLDPPYFHYLVSCATEAQALAVKGAFSKAESLLNPDDPRQIAFTVLPGHGIVIAEKWDAAKRPFQLTWEAMDAGDLQVENHVPQGPMAFEPDGDGGLVLREED